MKRLIYIVSLLICSSSTTFAYRELLIENRDKHPIRVIKVILDGQDYVVTSPAGVGGDTLSNLVKNVGGDAGVNGVFFCPDDYRYCNGVTHTISERIYQGDGKTRSTFRPDTSIRMIFGFDKNGEPLIVQNNLGSLQDAGLWTDTNKQKIGDIYFGLGNFPVFLLEGEDVIYGYEQYLDAKMKTRANKTFICSTKDNSTVYMGVVGGINLIEMPAYLAKNFDCYNAINLDAGNSIGMVYSGFVLDQGPRTRIMDAFVVLTRDQYINLTAITPPAKTPYIPSSTYTLTDTDTQKIKTIYTVLQSFITKNGQKQKRSFISLLRAALGSSTIQADPAKIAIIKELLFKMFVIHQI